MNVNKPVITLLTAGLVVALAGNAMAQDVAPAQTQNVSSVVYSGALRGRLLAAYNNYVQGGVSIGVFGESKGQDGRGVVGFATAQSGNTFGVIGRNYSPRGGGVYGHAHSAAGNPSGLIGISDAQGGRGVYAEATHPSGINFGMFARSLSTQGRGVVGVVSATTGVNYGVVGRSFSNQGVGVWGHAPAGNGSPRGVFGETNAKDGFGVFGLNRSTGFGAVGVQGVSHVRENSYGRGVVGIAQPVVSHPNTAGTGVAGYTLAKYGYGVYGEAREPQAVAVYGHHPNGQAGFFNGNVVISGNLIVRGTLQVGNEVIGSNQNSEHGLCSQFEFDGIHDPSQGNRVYIILPAPDFRVEENMVRIFLTPTSPSPNLHAGRLVKEGIMCPGGNCPPIPHSPYSFTINEATAPVYWMVKLKACRDNVVFPKTEDAQADTPPDVPLNLGE